MGILKFALEAAYVKGNITVCCDVTDIENLFDVYVKIFKKNLVILWLTCRAGAYMGIGIKA